MNEPQMITRCPECSTAFRVTQAQLLLREGRVRCGHCSAVFDARESLEILTYPPQAVEPTQEAPPDAVHEEMAPDARLEVAEQPLPPLVEEDEPAEPVAEEELPVTALASDQLEPEPATSPVAPAQPEAPAFRKPSIEPADAPLAAPEPVPQPRVVPPPPVMKRRPVVDEPLPDFLADKPKGHRLAWAVLAGLLLVMLNLQAIFYFRGAIALVWPAAKPAIEAMCARLRCELPLPKRADLMSIETSDLQAEPAAPGVMVLSATLRNRAAFPQAYPALELTLTNERDEALARRVLQPADYVRAPSPRVAEGIPTCSGGMASCEVQVRLHLEAAALKASGYRLYLFYP